MKNLKKYVGVLMLLTLLVGFTSCEDDETISLIPQHYNLTLFISS